MGKVNELAALEQRVQGSSQEAFERLRVALGAGTRDEVVALIRTDPEARRLAQKILGVSSPAGLKGTLNPPAPDQQPRGPSRPKIEF